MEKIDIVVTYLDDSDPKWRALRDKYKEMEIRNGISRPSNKQAFGDERTRDWNTLKYWFRGVEKNCPWVNKVFLVVWGPSQIPDWIDTTNPKLRIVYHDEFIPQELQPVFNSRPIELFTCRITDLSKNYIRCNDDCYFLNPSSAEMFFRNGHPVMPDNRREWKKHVFQEKDAAFWNTFNNNMSIEKDFLNGKNYTYGITHHQMPCDKEFELKVINKYYNQIFSRCNYSHFRNRHQFSIFLYDNLERLSGNAVIDDSVFKNNGYYSLELNLDYNKIKTKTCICLNDTDHANEHYEEIKKQQIKFFEELFPNKSSFEK